MRFSFGIRFKGGLKTSPRVSLPAATLPSCSRKRAQKVLPVDPSPLSASTKVWRWRCTRLKSRILWVVSLKDGSSFSPRIETFLRAKKERGEGRGGGGNSMPFEQPMDLCQAAKQAAQAFFGSLIGLAILLSSVDLGYAEEIFPDNNSSRGSGEILLSKNPEDLSRHNVAAALERGGVERVSRGMPHFKYVAGMAPAKPSGRVRFRSSSHSGMMPRMLFTGRKEIVHEGIRESLGVTYGQILQGRDDTAERQAMYTEDAWVGMEKLRQYDELLVKVEAEEKLCPECRKNRRLLEQVWQTVSNEYYDQYGSFSQAAWAGKLYDNLSATGGLLRTKKETYRAIKKMVESLGDRYTEFLNSEQYRLAIRRPIPSEIKYLTYQYTGVGVALGPKSPSGGLTIISPFAGSPAEEAGILAGERLLRIDGMPVDSFTAEEAGNLLRGPVGSIVELEVTGSQPGNSVRRVAIERRSLPLPPLRTRLVDAGDGRVLEYMRLHYFTHEATKSMAAAIRDGEALGVDGYILDLRNNPGGVFEEAIAMAAFWLDCQGCDVTETVRSSVGSFEDLVYSVNNLPQAIFFRHPGTLTHAPLAIITNRSSASASEVLTGALHDNRRAVIVGEKTFGKGVVQYFFPMDDGSGLKLTVEKYLTPARYDISKQGGLEPDRSCTDFPRQSEQSDSCIDQALEMLGEKQQQRSLAQRLPYRWVPLSESWFVSNGTH